VLLVEDDAPVRRLAEKVLRDAGYRVLEASSGEEALRLASDGTGASLDLLVTDMVMPGMSGAELAERVRALRPSLPVLYVSGYAEQGAALQGRVGAGAAYLPKPFTPAALSQEIRRLLDGRTERGPRSG
jgi:CheY-like chemotaxis protein